MRFFALKIIMENRITSKGEKEWMFSRLEENKGYILTPWEFCDMMTAVLLMVSYGGRR